MPADALVAAMAASFALKVGFEAALSPLTERLCIAIKSREGADHFDHDTRFTPLRFGGGSSTG